MELDYQAREALELLGFTIAGNAKVATITSEVIINVIAQEDGPGYLVQIFLPNGGVMTCLTELERLPNASDEVV